MLETKRGLPRRLRAASSLPSHNPLHPHAHPLLPAGRAGGRAARQPHPVSAGASPQRSPQPRSPQAPLTRGAPGEAAPPARPPAASAGAARPGPAGNSRGRGRPQVAPPAPGRGGGPARLRPGFLFRFPGRRERAPPARRRAQSGAAGRPGGSEAPALPRCRRALSSRPGGHWLAAPASPFPRPLVFPGASRGAAGSFRHTLSLSVVWKKKKLKLKLWWNLGQQREGFVSGSRTKVLRETVARVWQLLKWGRATFYFSPKRQELTRDRAAQ